MFYSINRLLHAHLSMICMIAELESVVSVVSPGPFAVSDPDTQWPLLCCVRALKRMLVTELLPYFKGWERAGEWRYSELGLHL